MHPHLPKLATLLAGLHDSIALQPKVIIIETNLQVPNHQQWDSKWVSWHDFAEKGKHAKLGRDAQGEIEWRRLSFDWPLWILFSSGTTGLFLFHWGMT